ncbi:hypothetical protein AX16_010164 [Volvariella volvacea WC 439]|nr:hypothetical protein AX16_010164 [Volvariella volvacea WC 439]
MSSGSGLPPAEHATFAVTSRLLSCLVTEQLLRAFYVPITPPNQATGVLVILSTHLISEQAVISRALRVGDIYAIVPLRTPPVFKNKTCYRHGREVGLVDPLDMLPEVYELTETRSNEPSPTELQSTILSCLVPPPWDLEPFTTLTKPRDAVRLWKKFVQGVVMKESLRTGIEAELASSYSWQLLAYNNPPPAPSLTSTPIEWEQSLVAGHPTHPMHRARVLPTNASSDYDWYHPRIRFAVVPRTSVDVYGEFEEKIRSLAHGAARRVGMQLPEDDTKIIMPVHELQVENVQAKFGDVEFLHPDISVGALAQSSIRTVSVPELPAVALKLAVGVKISSALRTISHFTATFGPRFSAEVVPKLHINPEILKVELEPHSAVYRNVPPDVAKHFSVVLREEYQPKPDEGVVVCAALLEMDHAGAPKGVSAVEYVFGLDTKEKRIAFLDRYIRIACEALLPPLLQDGLAFEAHAQNVLMRYDTKTGQILGFIVRDLGGIRVHPATLKQSTGIDFAFLPSHCVVTGTYEETFPKFYHTFVHNHLQRLIRVLGLHSNGIGWRLLRRHLRNNIPEDHPTFKCWLAPESKLVTSKSLLRMRIQDLYRDMVYSDVPNMILYEPEDGTYSTTLRAMV